MTLVPISDYLFESKNFRLWNSGIHAVSEVAFEIVPLLPRLFQANMRILAERNLDLLSVFPISKSPTSTGHR
jgi:hypothetical protein